MTGNIFTVDTKFGAATIAIVPGEGDVLMVISLGALPSQRIVLDIPKAGEMAKSLMASAELAKVKTDG